MIKKNLVSVSALGVMVFFAFGSTGSTTTVTYSDDFNSSAGGEAAPVAADAAPAASSGGATGIPECDAYLAKYRCFLKSMNQPTDAADQMEKTWKDSISNLPAAGADIGKKAIADGCKQSTSSMETQFSNAGC